MAIDALEAVTLCDSTQWIRVRGADASNPVLLLIQQGPGLPMINEVRRFEQVLDLERAFTVVYWDQRGCGLSLRGPKVPGGITVEQMIRDTVALLDLLRERFAEKSFVAGFSLGATVGAHAAAVRPDLVEALVAVAMDIDGVAAGTNAYDFALSAARRRGNRRAIRQLTGIGAPPHLTPKQFTTRVRWAANFGGVTSNRTYAALRRELLVSVARAHDYSIADLIRSLRGIERGAGRSPPRTRRAGPRANPAPHRCTDRHGARSPRRGGARRGRGTICQGTGLPEQAIHVVRQLGTHTASRGTGQVPRRPDASPSQQGRIRCVRGSVERGAIPPQLGAVGTESVGAGTWQASCPTLPSPLPGARGSRWSAQCVRDHSPMTS